MRLFLIGRAVNGTDIRDYLVGEVWVERGEIRVLSGSSIAQRELEAAIAERVSKGSFGVRRAHQDDDGITHTLFVQQPEEPEFLEAMLDASWFWDNRTFAGYRVDPWSSYVR